MIPPDIKFDPNATPPQFTNNEDSVIEVGTHVRVKLIGTRAEVGGMYAIASIKEDYLGSVSSTAKNTKLFFLTTSQMLTSFLNYIM
jgi:DNA-directed RNA polymerase II subunit RPB7